MTDGRHSVSLISPLAAAGRADEVVQRVSQAIQLGLFINGEQLPPETEFAAQLGVSAMTLREALAALRQQGLVETRRGRTGGTFVRRPLAPPVDVLRARLRAMTTSALRDLIDEQFAVSGAAARLAAARASVTSVRRLRALAGQLSEASSLGSRIRADSRFHIEVAIASQSERLTRLEVGLQTQLAELLWLPQESAVTPPAGEAAELPDPAATAAEHAAIAEAIAAEDGDTARQLAERHVEQNLRRLTALRLAMTGLRGHRGLPWAQGRAGNTGVTGRNESLADLEAAAARVRAVLEGEFGPVEAIGAAFLAQRRQCRAAGVPLSPERLAGMREVIWHQLHLLPAADGAGIVAAPGVVAGLHRHLEWWQRTAAGEVGGEGFARIRLNLDPESIDLYDYLDMDWFTVPGRERRRYVYGPYVDFSGADRYVLTMTVPVADGPEFLGVAGVDLRMSHLEPELLAVLRAVTAPAVLVTAERRVVAANTPRWISGTRLDRLPAPGDGDFEAVAAVGADSGWLLAAGSSQLSLFRFIDIQTLILED